MMKILSILCLLLGIVSVCRAQVITIQDQENGQPLELVNIASQLPKAYATTNAGGQADISAFKGSEKIQIRMVGYKTKYLSYNDLETASFLVVLETAGVSIDELIVSATRWHQTSRETPTKITSITMKEVALQNPQTAADMLAASGEVFIQKSQQGGGSPMIRGFSSNRLLYVIDGVRMNSAIFRAGNIQNVISLDPFATEKTEVYFGPGSVIYGSDAIGGVMSFQTLTPQFSASATPLISGKAVARYSSANSENTMHADIQIGWKKWASVSSFSSHQFGDLRMGRIGRDEYLKPFYVQRMDSIDHVVINEDPLVQKPTGYGQINLMQKIRFKPNENWDMQYGFHYSETTPYSRYDRLIETAPNGLPRAAVWNYGPQTWMMNQLSIAHQSTSKLFNEMSFRFALQSFGESRIDRNYSGGNRFRLRTQEENVDAYSANIDFEKASGVHKFYYGAEYILNDVTSRGSAIDIRDGSDIPTPDRYPASTWNSIGAYVNYQYKVSERLLFQSGVRVSQFSIQSDFSRHLSFFPFDFTESRINKRAVTGSIGAVYTPAPTWKISVNASTGFRAPNVDDIGKLFDFASGEVVVPNASLKSEYAYNGEVHVSKVFGDWLKLDVTGFYTQLQDAMVRRAFQVNGMDSILYNGSMSKVFAIQNAAKANVYGFNAGFEIKLPYRFTLFSRYNYQLGQEEMDNGTTSRSRHAAPAYGVTRLSYVYKKLNMQFYSMYSAGVSNGNLNEEEKQKPFLYAKDENGLPFSPSWVTFNLKSMYQISDHMIVSAGVENLTDRRYRPYSSGIVAAGRNMVLSLTAKF